MKQNCSDFLFWFNRLVFLGFLLSSSLGAQDVLFQGPASLPVDAGDPPMSGPGIRQMWYPDKAAFRTGSVGQAQWDKDSIGLYSSAWGENNIASGFHSTAWGTGNKAADFRTTVWGSGNSSRGSLSTVWGSSNHVQGNEGTAWGNSNMVLGIGATTWGTNNKAKSFLETVIGRYNDTLTSSSIVQYNPNEYLFVIGNGNSNSNRSNALEVYKNGNMRVAGSFTHKAHLLDITQDNQIITIESESYLRLTSNSDNATLRTIALSDGHFPGQVLYLENAGVITGQFELEDSGNAALSGTHTFTTRDIIQLLWNGAKWLEVHFSNN